MRTIKNTFFIGCVCFGFIVGCSNSNKEADKAAKIESEVKKVFDKFKKASEENDYKTMFESASRESIKRMVFEAIVAMGSGASSKESELILAKHVDQAKLAQLGSTLKNPTKEQVMELYLVCISDPKSMFIESYEYLQRHDPKRKNPTFGDLKDIKVTGEVASGKTVLTKTIVSYRAEKGQKEPERIEETRSSEVTVYFIRDGGKWVCATENEWAGIIGH